MTSDDQAQFRRLCASAGAALTELDTAIKRIMHAYADCADPHVLPSSRPEGADVLAFRGDVRRDLLRRVTEALAAVRAIARWEAAARKRAPPGNP